MPLLVIIAKHVWVQVFEPDTMSVLPTHPFRGYRLVSDCSIRLAELWLIHVGQKAEKRSEEVHRIRKVEVAKGLQC